MNGWHGTVTCRLDKRNHFIYLEDNRCRKHSNTRDGKLHLDPYEPTNTLTMVGGGDANGSGEPTVFTFDHAEMQPDSADKLQRLLGDASLLIMHNAQHDLQWLWGCGFKFDCDIYDTMLAEYVLCKELRKACP